MWDVVEIGIPEGNATQLREHRKRDSKYLSMIQQALHDDIFPLISTMETSKQEWEILKQEYIDDEKVLSVNLQTLQRDFENIFHY